MSIDLSRNIKFHIAEWYHNNKDKRSKYLSEKIECECGKTVCRGALSTHNKSEVHQKRMQQKNDSYIIPNGIKCICGLITTKDLIDKHLKSTVHRTTLEDKIRRGFGHFMI